MATRRRRAPGEGSVFRLASGKWRAQVRASLPNGATRSLTRTCNTKTEAVAALPKLRAKASRLGLSSSGDDTIAEYLDAWHQHRTSAELIRASTAVEEARHIQRVIAEIGSVKLSDVSRRDVSFLVARLSESSLRGKSRTIAHVFATLRKALNDAVREERLDRNPCDQLTPPRHEKSEIQSFDAATFSAILRAVDQPIGKAKAPDLQFAALVHLLAFSGMRIGEALALTWKQIDFDQSTVTIDATLKEVAGKLQRHPTKTGGRRVVKLPPQVFARMRTLRGLDITGRRPQAYVFRATSGQPLRQSNLLRRKWHPLLRQLELETSGFHRIRHTHSSLLIAQGVDLVTVAGRLGHSTPSTTLRVYAHAFQDRDAAASEAFEAKLLGEADREGAAGE